MKKTLNKALSILLVFTFIIGLFFVPQQAAHAASAKVDVVPGTLETGAGGNVKVSSENSTKKAPFAAAHNGKDYWQFGGTATAVFPAEGTGSLWIAVDLGGEKTFDEVSFDIPAGFSSVKTRISDYEVLYTSADNAWASLPGTSNSGLTAYTWSADWSLAKQIGVPASDAGDPNWGSLKPSNSGWSATTTGTLVSPVTARYVMIHFTVIPGNPGAIGMSNLQILNSETATDDSSAFADTYLNDPGSGYAIITPSYPGMSLTIGRPAVIDAQSASGKFPVFQVTKAVAGTTVAGTLIAPDGSAAYSFPPTAADAGGNAVMSVPDSVALAKGTYRAAFTLTNSGNTLYDNYYFTAIDDFANYRSIPNIQNSNNADVANKSPDDWADSAYPAIQMDGSGQLTYVPDYKGNQVMDYSAVGYKGGGTAIPNVPVRVKVAPLADDTQDAWQTIQDAIDYVSLYPVQEDGFRGAVYLEAGVFRISKPLNVNVSGVVIRGAGAGTVTPVVGDGTAGNPYDEQIASESAEPGVTKLISTWKIAESYTPPANHDTTTGSPYTKESGSTLINFTGQSVSKSVSTDITDQYVGAGQYSIHVASLDGFSVGDLVTVQKAINANWVKAMYMDKVDGASNWLPGGNLESGFAGTPFTAERTIKSIDAATRTITLAEPLSDNLDMRWGVSKIVKTAEGGRISNVGAENIQGISHFYNTTKPSLSRYGVNFKSYNDENHAEVFVAMVNVRDGWLRNFTTYHIDSAFVTDGSSRNITVQDGSVLDPVSLMNAGERRYSIYYKKSAFMFTQRVYSRYMRHAFIVDSYTSGPNVFYNNSSEYTSNASEPHFRWSSGGLYDNVAARIYLQNRWDMGTSHGWAGVNYMLYNFTGPFIATQPQLSPNYVIGHQFDNASNRLGSATDSSTGRQKPDKSDSANMAAAGLNGGKVPNFDAYEYSVTQKVTPAADHMPESLYVQQLINSHGPQAASIIAENTVPPMDDQSSDKRPKLTGLQVDGRAVSGFSPDVYSYTVTLPLDYDYSKKAEITAQAEQGVRVDVAYPQEMSGGTALITLTDAEGVKNFYNVAFAVIPKSPIVTASDEQVDSSNSNYAVNVLNPGDYAGTGSLRWAASGAAWIRMYLGETAKTVQGVQIGFVQHASNPRTYKLRIEYSTDGQNWSAVPSGTVVSETSATPVAWETQPDTYMNSLTVLAGTPGENVLQTFTFDTPVQARFIRIAGNGNMTGSSSNAWNNYWRLRPLFPQTEPPYTPPAGVAVSGPASLSPNGSARLQAQLTPSTATVTDVIWKSSDPAVAVVDSTGKVTAVAAGQVTITATTVDGAFVSSGMLQQASGTHEITVAYSGNAKLSGLSVDQGTLSPAFSPAEFGYTVDVPSSVSSLHLYVTKAEPEASISVTGAVYSTVTGDVYAYKASGLKFGSNPIDIAVTAQDGTSNSYRLTVNRAAALGSNADLSSLALSSGSLTPAFTPGTTAYAAAVDNSVSNITVTASVYDSQATMTVNGNLVASGQASPAVRLQVGANPVTIVVTAQDGTTKMYTVSVQRAAALSGNADLSSLTLSSGSLSPAFAPGTTAYTANVDSGVSSLTVTAAVSDSSAAVTVNGKPVASGQASQAVPLQFGSNPVTIAVTAQDGTTKTYNITVTRFVKRSSGGSGSSGGGAGTAPGDAKVTGTDGKLTLPAGKQGEVSLGDGIVVSIPANASNKELKITIEKVTDLQALLANHEILVSPIFEILKNISENFSSPVTLTFTFDTAGLPESKTAAVFYYDEAKKVWVEVAGGKIDGNKISVEVDHFTKFAVFAVDTAAEKPNPAVALSDIAGHWAEGNIKQAVNRGIVSGYPDGTFKPNRTVTRAEFAVMLMNARKAQGEGAKLTFTDGAEIGDWAQKAVAQAVQAGVVQGYEDGSFRPNAEITRAEMAVMIAKAASLKIEADAAAGFADDQDIPAWSKGAVAAMKQQKLIEGRDGNVFGPAASATRAEAVTVLLNLLAQSGK
ncbi:cadherin-like beta sandwich domain-containing protein [Paenibacillus doosanensis]|uniref:cadherin-like beta sandwich domain-containing protein n=1 Tax=Paenibacillus doosanensis TaxID=1229154 RepID=UPI00218011DA|nr:cadherin-like beta sandwich domain-containing protein [Paenibacillus doosanensis]MCS7463146.1 cadherin-like beta sandwich domain-containing protein [Paenibacillus doosanensis]